MLWEENTASIAPLSTAAMSVMVPIRSGSAPGSISSRISRQPRPAKGVLAARLLPQPTCKKVPCSGSSWGMVIAGGH